MKTSFLGSGPGRIDQVPPQKILGNQRPLSGLSISRARCARHKSRGNTLVITLVTVTILGFTLASYLDLTRNQNVSTMRSQAWNSSIPVLEAGVEEALTQLFYYPTNRSANGWNLLNGAYTKQRDLGLSRYVVTISTDSVPVIISKAYVRIPLHSDFINPPRTVRVTVTNAPMFAKGMVAKGSIDLSGNLIRTDSFDSSDPAHSNNGQYDPGKAKDNGDVATNSSVVDTLDVWNADIFGKASTGPGGNVQIGQNGSVGSAAWHAAGNQGIEPGWSNDDMNVQFPNVRAPFSGGALSPAGGSVGGTNYTYVLTSGNWQLDSLELSGQDNVLVTGTAILYVKSEIKMTGSSYILIATNSNLQLYMGGSTASIGGNGVINSSGNATNFYYFGMPANTSLALAGNAAFVGSIYAPQANFTLGGGGNNAYDFVGASVTGTVKMNGHFNFHYDENLGRVGPDRGFTITSWNEMFTWEEL